MIAARAEEASANSRLCWLSRTGFVPALLAAPCFADTLALSSGEKLIGEILSEDDASVVFESAGLGKLAVPRDRMRTAVRGPAPSTAQGQSHRTPMVKTLGSPWPSVVRPSSSLTLA